jgi:hypothetical protein
MSIARRFDPPPELGFARREAHYDQDKCSGARFAGSAHDSIAPRIARRGDVGEPGVLP